MIDAFEFNNPTSDSRFGAQDVAKNYMMGSYHQATEYFEIIFNKDKFNALPAEHQAILEYAAEAASTANLAIGLDNYSRDLVKLQQEQRRPGLADAASRSWTPSSRPGTSCCPA